MSDIIETNELTNAKDLVLGLGGSLDKLLGAFSTSSFTIRKQTVYEFKNVIKEFIDDQDKKSMFDAASRMIFATSSTWRDNTSRKLIDSVLYDLSKELGSKFVFPMLEAWASRIPTKIGSVDCSMLEKWINWSNQIWIGYSHSSETLEEKTQHISENQEHLSQYIKAFLVLVNNLLDGKASDIEDRVARNLADIVSYFPEVAEEYLKQSKGTKTLATSYTSTYTLFHAYNIASKNQLLKTKISSAWEKTRTTILAAFVTEVVNPINGPKPRMLTLFKFVHPLIQAEDLAGEGGAELMSSIIRGLRRAPQMVFISCVDLFKRMPKNLLAPFIADLMPSLLNEMRNLDASRRSKAKDVLCAISTNTTELETRSVISTFLVNSFLGKNGNSMITAIDTRLSFADAIAAFASNTDTETLTSISQALLEQAGKEPMVTSKESLYSAVATACMGNVIPDLVIDAFAKLIIDTDATVVPYPVTGVIKGIVALLSDKHEHEGLMAKLNDSVILEKLITIINMCAPRPAQRSLGIAALSIILLSTGSPILLDKSESTTTGPVVPLPESVLAHLNNDSFAFNVEFASSISSSADLDILMTFFQALFERHLPLLLAKALPLQTCVLDDVAFDNANGNLYRSCIALMTQKVNKYRLKASQYFAKLMKDSRAAPLSSAFLNAVFSHVNCEDEIVDPVPVVEVTPEEDEPIYIACWDGNDTFLAVQRYVPDMKVISHAINGGKKNKQVMEYVKNDPLRGIIPVTTTTAQLAGITVSLMNHLDAGAVSTALLLASHPKLACDSSNSTTTLSVIAKHILKLARVTPSFSNTNFLIPLLPVVDNSLRIQALLSYAIFNADSAWLLNNNLKNVRASINLIAFLSVAAPNMFKNNLMPKLVSILYNKDLFSLNAYKIAVYLTPSWKNCDVVDPEEASKPQIVENKNQKVKAGYTKAEHDEMMRKKAEEEKLKSMNSGVSQTEKEAMIREQVHRMLIPITNTLIAVEAVCVLAPATAHSLLMTPCLPLIHQYILGYPLSTHHAGISATEESYIPKTNFDSYGVNVGHAVMPLVRDVAKNTLMAFGKTLDLHIVHDTYFITVIADTLISVWERPASELFSLISAVVNGDRDVVMNDKLGNVITLCKSMEYMCEQVTDNPLSAPSFAFLLPCVDALLRFAPEFTDSETHEDSTEALSDAVTADEPSEDDLSFESYKTSLLDALKVGIDSAASILSIHCGAAASTSSNKFNASSSVSETVKTADARFPVSRMIELILISLARVSDTHVQDILTSGLVRICSVLQPYQINTLLTDKAIFSQNIVVRTAVLSALAKVQHLLAAKTIMLSAGISMEEVSSTPHALPESSLSVKADDVIEDVTEEDNRVAFAVDIAQIMKDLAVKIWTLTHDKNHNVVVTAKSTFATLQLEDFLSTTGEDTIMQQLNLLSHSSLGIRTAASNAVAAMITPKNTEQLKTVMSALRVMFIDNNDYVIKKTSARESDRFIDRSDTRIAIVNTMLNIAGFVGSHPDLLQMYIDFFVSLAFADENSDVFDACLAAGTKVIHMHGTANLSFISSLLRKAIDSPNHEAVAIAASASSVGKKGVTDEMRDALRIVESLKEGSVLLLGALARYFKAQSQEVVDVFNVLLSALGTTPHSIQKSISHIIIPLIPSLPGASAVLQGKNNEFVDSLFNQQLALIASKEYNVRTGAAIAIGAFIYSLKGKALMKYNILEKLAEAIKSKQAHVVHGALCTYEAIFDNLGNIITPYISSLLQSILPCFGNSDRDVREAAVNAAGAMMKHLNHTGVRVLMPILLNGLRDKAWRTKIESIQMLSTMANLAPRELAICLPMIVPKLLEVMTDPNQQVQASAKESITVIASAIKNPEVRKMCPILTAALTNRTPTNMAHALNTIFTTVFQHYIDPASLALIIPIIRQGLRQDDPKSKKIAVQIAGSVSQITTDPRDLAPYTDVLVRYLRSLLMDSLPDVRTVTAKAIGTMSTGSLSSSFADLLELLLNILSMKKVKIPAYSEQTTWAESGTTPTIRSGASLGAAQLLLAKGLPAAEEVLDNLIVPSIEDKRAHVREGFIMLLHALPVAFGTSYGDLLIKTLPVALGCFSDPYAVCREWAVKAGQHLVVTFARSQTPIILASMMEALIDDNYRVRLGALQLTGNFLLRLAGLTGELSFADMEEDAGALPQTVIRENVSVSTEAQEALIIDALTLEQRNEMFTFIYLMRSDVVSYVSIIAWRVWKAVVLSTGKTLATILPYLVERITTDLASWNEYRQQTAGNALSELVTKLGDRILRDIVPLLLDKLSSPDIHTRRGVCLGLREIFNSSTKSMLSNYMPDFIPAMQAGLCDPNESVREAAGLAYIQFVGTAGERAVKEVIPLVLKNIDKAHETYLKNVVSGEDDEVDFSDHGVDGLKYALGVRLHERYAMEAVIPHLLQSPITSFRISILSRVSDVCGRSLGNYLDKVVYSLQRALEVVYESLLHISDDDVEVKADLLAQEAQLLNSVENVISGLGQSHAHTLLSTFMYAVRDSISNIHVEEQVAAVKLLSSFFKANSCDDEELGMLNEPLNLLLPLLLDDNEHVCSAAAVAVDSIYSHFSQSILIKYTGFVRTKFNEITGKKKSKSSRLISEIHGLCNGNIVASILATFQFGLLSNNTNLRVQNAAGIADLIELAPATALQPHVMKLTGFLIRTFGDRLPVEIRVPILQSIGGLLRKSSAQLKPFQSQLKTSLLKALHDESSAICEGAAFALANMPKPETFVMDMFAAAQSQYTTEIGGKVLKAITYIYNQSSASEMPVSIAEKILSEVQPFLISTDSFDNVRVEAAKLTGILVSVVDEEIGTDVMSNLLSEAGIGSNVAPHWVVRQSVAMVMSSILNSSDSIFLDFVGYKPAIAFIARGFKDDNENACSAALRFAGRLLKFSGDNQDSTIVRMLMQELIAFAQPQRVAEHIALCALEQVSSFAEKFPDDVQEVVHVVVPLCLRTRTGAGKAIRKEADTIMYYALGFNVDYDTGMENAEVVGEKLDSAMNTEFISICKRSICKIGKESD